jgi:hypothetical protein
VLLPDVCLLRRCDAVEVIGAAVLAVTGGTDAYVAVVGETRPYAEGWAMTRHRSWMPARRR